MKSNFDIVKISCFQKMLGVRNAMAYSSKMFFILN